MLRELISGTHITHFFAEFDMDDDSYEADLAPCMASLTR